MSGQVLPKSSGVDHDSCLEPTASPLLGFVFSQKHILHPARQSSDGGLRFVKNDWTSAAILILAGCTKEVPYGDEVETTSTPVDTGLRVEPHPHAVDVEWTQLGLTPAGETWTTLDEDSGTHHKPPPPPDGNDAYMSGLSVSIEGDTLYVSAELGEGQRGRLIWDMVHPKGTPEDY